MHSLCRQNSPETLPLKLQSLPVTNASASIRSRCFYTKHFLRRKANQFKQQAFIVQPTKRFSIRDWTLFSATPLVRRCHGVEETQAPACCGALGARAVVSSAAETSSRVRQAGRLADSPFATKFLVTVFARTAFSIIALVRGRAAERPKHRTLKAAR